MPVIGQVKGFKEEVDQMIKKKDKVEDLLGENMQDNSGMFIDGTRYGFNACLNSRQRE